MRHLTIISLCLAGCAETLTPDLPPAPTHTPVAQLAQEGKLDPGGIWSDDNQAIEFSIPAEQLAALPRALLDPVREHVQAYLAGRPLTGQEKRQLREAARSPGTPPGGAPEGY